MDGGLTALRWDEEYRRQRYIDEPPLPFVREIVETVRRDPVARPGLGLYVGCGNGRNYLALLDAGLDVVGLDISSEALKSLAQRRPSVPPTRLRVNSASTEVYHAHTVLERNALGGFTVRYDEGPKTGLPIHFYSAAELTQRLDGAFVPVQAPREDVTVRTAPKVGSRAQWETIWRRRHLPA